jgi:Flp pilus assembly protein TadG
VPHPSIATSPRRHAVCARSERGTALVELALALPVLLLVLFGVIHLGKGVNYWIDGTHMANEAARFAAVDKNPGGGTLQAYVLGQADTNELKNGGTSAVKSPAQVCIDFPNGTSNVGDPVRATVKVTYNWLPLLQKATKVASTAITSTATMRLEATPSHYSAGCT